MDLLRTTNDIVFKMLLLREESLLRSMLTAVLRPPSPITRAKVTNPELLPASPGDRSFVLDIRVLLEDGTAVDLEMQVDARRGLRERLLAYWARQYAEGLRRGAPYTSLRPSVVIVWLTEPLLEVPRFHGRFRLQELTTGELFSEHLAIHVLELRSLFEQAEGEQDALLKWGWFLQTTNLEVLEALAEGDPIMTLAKDTLLELSADEKARQIALERDLQDIAERVYVSAAHEQGRQEGRLEGRLEGRAELLLAGLEARGDVLTADQRARVQRGTADELLRWTSRAMRGVPLAELFNQE